MKIWKWPSRSWCLLASLLSCATAKAASDDDFNVLHRDGSYQFGYETPDSYHYANANRNNVVKGEFGARSPATGAIDSTVYTAGPRGYRPRGRNVVRKYDLNQNGPLPIGSRDDPYFDPFEDPSYSFKFRTRTYSRQEDANRVGDVTGKYTYLDDIGERHNVEFIAGKNTGFHVKTPFPDSNPNIYGPLYFRGRGKPIPRGRTSIQRGLDGSYRFVSAGPDQRRTETSDATGHVRGSYTYLDDKGVQHSVHYIAGPETGYRVLKNVKGPHLPTVFPFGRPDIIPPDFYDYKDDPGDLFDLAATEHGKPGKGSGSSTTSKPSKIPSTSSEDYDQYSNDLNKPGFGDKKPGFGKPRPSRPPKPSYDYGDDGNDFNDDLFGGGSPSGGGGRPSSGGAGAGLGGGAGGGGVGIGGGAGGGRPSSTPGPIDDGSYRPSGDDGSYKPSGDGLPRPTGALGSPDYGDANNDVHGGSFGLFGSETNSRPPRPPTSGGGQNQVIHIGNSNPPCEKCRGTVVTNVGDTLFSVPPGVSVRAHVQSIDLLPLEAKIPSPSDQYKAEMTSSEQLNSASNDNVVATSRPPDYISTIEDQSKTEEPGSTTETTIYTTTTKPPPTTVTTTAATTTAAHTTSSASSKNSDDGESDVDIF